jgi:hypothetical protein
LAPGAYRLAVYSRSTITGIFTAQVRDMVVRPPGDPHMSVDGPLPGATVRVRFTVGGWAIDRDAPTETGVDTIHVWAFPASGGAAVFLGVATAGGIRPDVSAAFGPQFTASGYSLSVSSLTPGPYQIVVYAHSAVTGTFSQTRVVSVTVR